MSTTSRSNSPDGLSENQWIAAKAIAGGAIQKTAAQQAGVTVKTIQRWMDKPTFTKAIASIQGEVNQTIVTEAATDISARIQALLPKAVGVLESYLDDPDAKGSDRLRACHILGAWAGMTQPQQKDVATQATEQLSDYLNYLAGKNGHSN